MPVLPERLTCGHDALLTRAVVPISNSAGMLLGTGAFITADGAVLTAHHVIRGMPEVIIRTHSGHTISVETGDALICESADIAVLLTGFSDCEALPVISSGAYYPSEFRSRGFQYGPRGLDDAVPLTGRVEGQTRLRYDSYKSVHVVGLRNSDIDNASSGAPLYDPDCRAVVGVIVARMGDSVRQAQSFRFLEDGKNLAFAVPFDSTTMALLDTVRPVFDRSAQTLPSFGPLMNGLGARTVCDLQRERSLAELVSAGLFKPAQTVERKAVSAVVSQFLNAELPILALVGISGVGKTSALARFAQTGPHGRFLVLFIRAVDIDASADGIRGTIATSLSKLRDAIGLQGLASVDHITRACRTAGHRLLVVLDGLNEAPTDLNVLTNSWIPKSLNWLQSNDVRLVVSSRPEAWSAVAAAIPKDLVFRSEPVQRDEGRSKPAERRSGETNPTRNSKTGPVLLGNFTYEEARQAVRAYDLERWLPPADALHPFVLAVAAEIGREAAPVITNLVSLMELFVRRKIERALRAEHTLWVERVLFLVENVARRMLDNKAQSLPDREMVQEFGQHSNAVEDLEREHLWLLESDGYRFQFDLVREFLQSRHLPLFTVLWSLTPIRDTINVPLLWRHRWRSPLNAFRSMPHRIHYLVRNTFPHSASLIAFSVLRLLPADAREFLLALELLGRAVVSYPSTQSGWHAQATAVSVISRLPQGGAVHLDYIAWVESIVKREVGRTFATERDVEITEGLTWAVSGLRIPPANKLALLQRMFVTESETDWNSGLRQRAIWELRLGRGREGSRPLLRCLAELAASEPKSLVASLLDCLGDETPIGRRWRQTKVTIGDAAASCLFLLRSCDLEGICSWLMSNTTRRAADLIGAIAVTDANAVFSAIATELLKTEFQLDWVLARALFHGVCLEPSEPTSLLVTVQVASMWLVKSSGDDALLRLWLARVILGSYLRCHEIMKGGASSDSWAAAIVNASYPHTEEASAILAEALRAHRTFGDILLPKDCDYLLQFDFTLAVEALRPLLPENAVFIEGVLEFLSPGLKRYPARRPQYRECCLLLLGSLYSCTESCRHIIAETINFLMQNALINDFWFNRDDVVELGFLDLSLRMIRHGGPEVRREFRAWASLAAPGPIRDAILLAFRDDAIDPASFMNFVHELYYRVRHHNGSFEELSSYRAPGRYEQWDKAVLTSMDWGNQQHVDWFRDYVGNLDALTHSQPLRDFLFLLQRGRTLHDAAMVAASYTDHARKWELLQYETFWQRFAAFAVSLFRR